MALPLTAQQNPNSSRLEVGLDVLSLFDKNSLPAYSLFGRYWINPSGEKPAFLRSRLGYQTTNNTTNTTKEFYTYQEFRKQNLLATIGFQKDIYTTPVTSFYYGADIVHQRLNDLQFLTYGDEVIELAGIETINDNTNISTSISGFVGFSRKFKGNIALSFESALYIRQSSSSYQYSAIFLDGSINNIAQNSSKKFIAGANPFYQIVLTITIR
ncbi:hypothetical protein D0X99_03450 [Algoriphagus lacus]|uniref:DUF481 domain-containing protein n=1 Tax=Algoriphagus lacus TaxID=2056311 RepID=A0A418PX74_9BACT|nr:hypothetical protein D0X99_03450 [Algoriphagus lacus]